MGDALKQAEEALVQAAIQRDEDQVALLTKVIETLKAPAGTVLRCVSVHLALKQSLLWV